MAAFGVIFSKYYLQDSYIVIVCLGIVAILCDFEPGSDKIYQRGPLYTYCDRGARYGVAPVSANVCVWSLITNLALIDQLRHIFILQ